MPSSADLGLRQETRETTNNTKTKPTLQQLEVNGMSSFGLSEFPLKLALLSLLGLCLTPLVALGLLVQQVRHGCVHAAFGGPQGTPAVPNTE